MKEIDDAEEYDVVLDVLQKYRDELSKMTESNMRANLFNIMDTLRLEAIDEINEAIGVWKKHKRDKESKT